MPDQKEDDPVDQKTDGENDQPVSGRAPMVVKMGAPYWNDSRLDDRAVLCWRRKIIPRLLMQVINGLLRRCGRDAQQKCRRQVTAT